MKVRVRREAADEIRSAREWYGRQRKGLGDDFVAELRASFALLEARPESFPLASGFADVRRALLERFPYAVYFLVGRSAILVVAVAHQRRRPEHWQGRLGGE